MILITEKSHKGHIVFLSIYIYLFIICGLIKCLTLAVNLQALSFAAALQRRSPSGNCVAPTRVRVTQKNTFHLYNLLIILAAPSEKHFWFSSLAKVRCAAGIGVKVPGLQSVQQTSLQL